MDYKFGQRLVVELISTEIFEGEYVSGSKTRIDLTNVTEYDTGNPLKGPITFYQNEISKVHILNTETENECELNSKDLAKLITIPKCEYERLKELSQNFIYIASIDRQYYDACEHLNNLESVGLVTLGSLPGRLEKLNLLVISSWNQVYIFDMHLFNKKYIPKELKMLIVSKDIKKIMHDSRSVVDCFQYCYNLTVENVFDTQVADVMVRNKTMEEGETKNLGECLTAHFNFPIALLERAMTLGIEKWKERPLNNSKKVMAAQLATYLIVLKNHLESSMLKDFYLNVEKYSTSTLKCTSVEAQVVLNKSNLPLKMNNLTINGKVNDSNYSSYSSV